MKKAPNHVEGLSLATHRPEAMLLSGNMETISQHSITTKLRLDLNGDAESPLSCSRANDYRGRIDPSASLATVLRLGGVQPRHLEILFVVMVDSVGEDTQAEGCDGRSRVARC